MATSSAPKREFASDNYAGICPEAWNALQEANLGHAPSYGEDIWTQKASDLIRQVLEKDCEVFFVFNGTAANSLALASLCDSFHSVICHQTSHVETDECGAPGFFSHGTTLTPVPGLMGKLQPESISEIVARRNDIHYPRPRVVTLTQSTELGTVYSVQELQKLGECTRKLNLQLHMDGARFANAVAALDVAPRQTSWEAGVTALSFGGTKSGMAYGEAVVFFDKQHACEFDYRCKQAGQLSSKMRFIAAQWVGLLQDGAWLRHARHANDMAAHLESHLRKIPNLNILYQRQANAVFVELTPVIQKAMHGRGWHFYNFASPTGVRFMCSWDTQIADIEALAKDLREVLLP